MDTAKKIAVVTLVVNLLLWFVQVLVPHLLWVRLGVSVLLALVVAGFFGLSIRPAKMAGQSLSVALIFSVAYGFIILGTMIIFGGANNLHATSASLIRLNIIFAGGPLIFQEFIRHKLMRAAQRKSADSVAMLVTIAFTFSRLPMLGIGMDWLEFLFSMVLFSLLLNILLTTISKNGSYFAQLLIGFVFGLTILISPVLPSMSMLSFTIVTCVLMYICWHVYMILISDTEPWQAARIKRLERNGFPLMAVLTVAFLALAAAFMFGAFRFYPLAVLTDSMSGTFERGALVIVERVDPTNLSEGDISRGDVIHFSRGAMEITHRVVEYRFDQQGRRLFITRGDANSDVDSHPVTPDDILGIVRMVMPHFGHPAVWIAQIRGGSRV